MTPPRFRDMPLWRQALNVACWPFVVGAVVLGCVHAPSLSLFLLIALMAVLAGSPRAPKFVRLATASFLSLLSLLLVLVVAPESIGLGLWRAYGEHHGAIWAVAGFVAAAIYVVGAWVAFWLSEKIPL